MNTRHISLVAPALVVGALAAGAAAPASADAARGQIFGVQDDRLALKAENPAARMKLVKSTRAKLVRVDLRWDEVAKTRPKKPRNPADAAYDWSHYDKVVTAARKRKVRVLFTIWGTPGWAADPRVAVTERLPRYGIAPRKASDAGNFAAAAARRYSRRGVKMWEAWNEPNIPIYLQPQYTKRRGKWVASSPRRYSAILKAMYKGIKSVDRRAIVGGGVTAPVGDKRPQTCPVQPNCRVQPHLFMKALGQKGLRPPMDVVSHHPYPLRPPSNKNFAGASYVDLYNLSKLTKTIDRTYLRRKKLWLTEFGISTRKVKQYPFHRSRKQQAAGLKDALRRVKRNKRVKVFVWYFLQDHDQWASGLITKNGKAKPALKVFRRLAR